MTDLTAPSLGHRTSKARFTPRRPTTAEFRPRPRRRQSVRRWGAALSTAAAAADALIVLVLTCAVSYGLRWTVATNDVVFGALVAGVFLSVTVSRHGYAVSSYLAKTGQGHRVVGAWCIAFLAAITIGFLTKTGDYFSRAMALATFGGGLVTLVPVRFGLARMLTQAAKGGTLVTRTIFLVGDETAMGDFTTRFDLKSIGLRLAGGSVIRPEPEHLEDDLALAAATARMLRADDIFILAPWGDGTLIAHCVDHFLRLPVAIHIGPEAMLQQFADMRVVRNGALTSVHVAQTPLSPSDVLLKRIFDVVAAVAGLIVLAPLLLLIALLVKCDSPGPVLFRQTRYGFNREPFRIFKFRSMLTMDNGAQIRQATRHDRRVTRIGRWLRRTSLDELPQLLNVIAGDMSLVGPRPHAIAHDQAFEGSVSRYARRHNVRPGITGWAQVHGWRGETDTADKIRARVEYDLYYVDNWSLWLDFVILIKTVLSRSVYLNAH